MSKIKKHLQEEFEDWEREQLKQLHSLNAAWRHLILNVLAYLSISIIEYFLAEISNSQTLRADAFNNISGIVSTMLLMIGIHIARDIDDDDIAGMAPLPKLNMSQRGNDQRVQFTRFRYETVFTLVTGVVMIGIVISVISTGIINLWKPDKRVIPEPIALVGAGIATVIMLIVWYLNRRAGRKLQNAALSASAQDSLSDAFTSIGTLISISGALIFKITWLDGATSILVGLFILYSGFKIFMDSSLNLVDYFDPKVEEEYRNVVLSVPGVAHLSELKAHYNGNIVSLDIVVMVDAKMSVLDSYRIAENIERIMHHRFGIMDTDVAFIPDPSSIDDDEIKDKF